MKKFLFTVLFLGVVAFGVYRWRDKLFPATSAPAPTSAGESASPGSATRNDVASADAAALKIDGRIESSTEVEPLAAPQLYQMKDGVFDLELSEYAGYAGLIVANGGLEPSENSTFFKNYGFKVHITLSEEESWNALNSGRIGGSATTADVLAVYAKSFQAVVPAQIGYSRGADAVVVTSDIKRVNHLKGKVLIASQFTEADFFIRYLAGEAGLSVVALQEGQAADPEAVNLIYAEDAFTAGDIFAREVNAGNHELAGAVVWGSKIKDVLDGTGGKTRLLVDNRNLLVVADVLLVNKPFAEANPRIVEGLVDGLLTGNDLVRTNPEPYLDVIGKAFKWTSRDETRQQLVTVHLSNLPENRAFFSGAIDAAGSYGGIFQSAMLAYGPILNHSVPPERLLDLQLDPLAAKFASQTISIQPIRAGGNKVVEDNPLLTRDIRFYFEPNSAKLGSSPDNDQNYDSIKKLLQVSPGSTILLRGHVDNSLVEQFRQQGGEPFVRQMALKAMQLSRDRADAVRTELTRRYNLPVSRIEVVGRGWEEPAGTDAEKNRRVEVQWFTLE